MNARAWPTVGSSMSPRGSFGFGSSANREVVAPVADIGAAEVHRLGVAVERGAGRPWPHRPRMPSRPPHITYTSAPSSTPSSMASSVLATREPADGRIVGGERTLLEHRATEQVGRGHRHLHARLVEGRAEALHDDLPLGVARPEAARGRRRGSSRRTRRARRGGAPTSTGSSGGRTSRPNGSRPGLPTVQSPNVKRCSGRGSYGSVMAAPVVMALHDSPARSEATRPRPPDPVTVRPWRHASRRPIYRLRRRRHVFSPS